MDMFNKEVQKKIAVIVEVELKHRISFLLMILYQLGLGIQV